MKIVLKRLVNAIAMFCVLPAVAAYYVNARVSGPLRAFGGWSQLMSLFPGTIGIYLRQAFYWCVLRRCDRDASIGFGTILSHPTAEIGRTVYIGAYCCLGDVTLEDDVLLASQVSIANGSQQHGIERLDIPIREQPGHWPRITIGQDSWIGERAVVLANVGRHCVIGAGSVVTKPIPDYAIAVGTPARVVRFRNAELPGPIASNDERGNLTAAAR